MASIHEAMVAILKDVGHIGKDKKNLSQGFSYRGIDDVYNELHGLMGQHGVYTTSEIVEAHHEERQSSKGGVLLYRIYTIRYTFWAADGTSVQTVVVGEGMDSGDKASNKAMAVAHKYALLQAFVIPTEDMPDPDADAYEVAKLLTQQIDAEMRTAETVAALVKVARKYAKSSISEEQRQCLNKVYEEQKTKLNGGVK